MHFISRRHHNLMRHLLLIEGGEPQGGAGEPPAGQNTNGEGDNAKNTTTDNAKEFSHALAARVEEEKAKLEAKYAGYDEYKAKAAKYDANESGNAAKLEAADKKIEALTKEITTLKVKAISYKFQETFFNGDTDVDTKSFDGLKKRLTGKQVIDAAENGMPILGDSNADIHKFFDKLDELLGAVPGINPTNGAIYASSAIIRKIGSAMRHISYDTTLQQDIVGKRAMQWNGIPLLEAGQTPAGEEILDNNETQGTNSTTTSIYAVKFGASEGDQGVTGLTNGGVQVEDLGQLQEKPAYRTRIEFYCGLGVFSGKAAARLKGVVNG